MSDKSSIEWTEATLNPWTGCTKVSPGCARCLDPETLVLMADMTWRAIWTLEPGDEVVGFTDRLELGQNRVYERAVVEHVREVTTSAVAITVDDREIIASEDHRFLARVRPYWREAQRLGLWTEIVDIGMPRWTADLGSENYLAGYAAGVIRGDGTFRISEEKQSYMRVAVMESDGDILRRLIEALSACGCSSLRIQPYSRGPGAPMDKVETRRRANLELIRDVCLASRDHRDWKAGYLAGMLDTDGSHNGNLRYSQTKPNDVLDCVHAYVGDLGFSSKREDFRSHAGRNERLVGDQETRARFLATIQPALIRKTDALFGRRFPAGRGRAIDGIRRVGRRDLVDIQTSSGTFIAAGLATHNCYIARTPPFKIASRDFDRKGKIPLVFHMERLEKVVRKKKPTMYFVNSLSDLFHEDAHDQQIAEVFGAMARAPQHTFQILTKRPERMKKLLGGAWIQNEVAALAGTLESEWPLPNVWLGVSIENRRFVGRADVLRETPAAIRFISAEPLLGPIADDLDLTGIDWLIAGGESGQHHRRLDLEWVRQLRDECLTSGTAFFVKQLGGARPGTKMEDLPEDLRIREYPSRLAQEEAQGTLL